MSRCSRRWPVWRGAWASSLGALGVIGAVACRSDRWTIDPAAGAGPLNPTADLQSLEHAFGREAVQAGPIELGEGIQGDGAVLFAGDSLRRIEVVWGDSARQARPVRLILRGDRSRWRTAFIDW